MGNFFRIATVILLGATGIYIYELAGGDLQTADKVLTRVPVRAVAVSRSPAPRIRSMRTIDRSKPMPPRPPGLEQMIEARGGSDFPVLIPHSFIESAAVAKGYAVRLKLSDDGYTSVLTLPDYDVVIYGTRSAFRTAKALRAEKEAAASVVDDPATASPNDPVSRSLLPKARGDYDMTFEDGDDGRGGSLSFGRYGVDYHIEFYCHGEAQGCVDAAGARAFVVDMTSVTKKKKKKEPRLRIEIGIGIGSPDRSDRNTQQREPGR